MNSSLSTAIKVTDVNAQYDQCAKKLLAHKRVLAHILVKTVKEFRGMKVDDVIPLIEGEPLIGKVYVNPGVTNSVVEKDGEKIIGFNTEESEINEGVIRYDIIFYVLTRNGRSKIIINIEAQKNKPKEYNISNRAIHNPNRIGLLYIIITGFFKLFFFLRRNQSAGIKYYQEVSSMNYIHLTDQPIIGNVSWEGNLDLLNIIFLGIPKEIPDYDETHDLHRLLGTLFSDSMKSQEKMERLKEEYSFPLEDSFEEVVKDMCNLSYGIQERAFEEGIEKGIEKGEINLIRLMLQKGYKAEVISGMTDIPIDKIKRILEDVTLTK